MSINYPIFQVGGGGVTAAEVSGAVTGGYTAPANLKYRIINRHLFSPKITKDFFCRDASWGQRFVVARS